MKASCLRLVLGDQLNHAHSWYAQSDDDILYVIAELRQETDYARHHVQKICAFFAAMEQFARHLQAEGHRVLHLDLDATAEDADLPALLRRLLAETGAVRLEYQRPDEYRVLDQLRAFAEPGVSCHEVDTEHFLLPWDELDDYFEAGRHRTMEFFYRAMRRRYRILIDGDGPVGGRWNFDVENRRPISAKAAAAVPEPLLFPNPVGAIVERLQRHAVATIGQAVESLPWPVTRTQSLELLDHFCHVCLPDFGRYQDAMTTVGEQRWSLYHSRLSFALNAKLLSPLEVIGPVVARLDDGVDIAAVEGFVRQVLGWREFVRGVYWANMPDYATRNGLDAAATLPEWFWTGETGMRCLSEAVSQSLQYAYAHHIQRLMITGNFCLLAGIEPQQVDDWYLGIYVDALDWVELPNTRGMSQFADGGVLATKPYCASGSYVHRMSDYCRGCRYNVKTREESDSCPLNSLYWHFLARHRERFEANPRMRMPYRNLDRMDADTRERILERGEWCLQHLESL